MKNLDPISEKKCRCFREDERLCERECHCGCHLPPPSARKCCDKCNCFYSACNETKDHCLSINCSCHAPKEKECEVEECRTSWAPCNNHIEKSMVFNPYTEKEKELVQFGCQNKECRQLCYAKECPEYCAYCGTGKMKRVSHPTPTKEKEVCNCDCHSQATLLAERVMLCDSCCSTPSRENWERTIDNLYDNWVKSPAIKESIKYFIRKELALAEKRGGEAERKRLREVVLKKLAPEYNPEENPGMQIDVADLLEELE